MIKEVRNGRVPKKDLSALSWAPKHRVHVAALASLEELNLKYRERFGVDMTVNYSYRSLLRQVGVKFLYGDGAAPVGESMHGFGLALDLGGGVEKSWSDEHKWMRRCAPEFMWINPQWAHPLGSNPEPWHWEFGREGQ